MMIIYIAVAFLLGLFVSVLLVKAKQKQIRSRAQQKANKLLRDARQKANELSKEAKQKSDELVKNSKRKSQDAVDSARRKFERSKEASLVEAQRAEQKAKSIEKSMLSEKRNLDETREKAEKSIERAEKAASEHDRLSAVAKQAEEHFETKSNAIKAELEKVAGMTQKEAVQSLVKNLEDDAKLRSAKLIRQIEENAHEESEKLSKRVISIAISRYASDYVSDNTTSSISLPNDDLKGRLIGREGRNIRALENILGCDLIIDDTPETVVVSCFDPVRRHIGKLVLQQLVADGRVHPSRIEEIHNKVKKQTGKSIKDAGEKALLKLDIVSMHPELVKVIGQLQFRYSYNQNQYHHVIETGHLCGLMAAELGLDVAKARRAGLLHDIGKALTHEIEGSHAMIGADLCEKYGEEADITYAVRAHHEDVKPNSWLDYLVMGADAISGARPGARQEQYDAYVRRLKDLERIASNFQGVERSFAINAGREVRVMVENSKINDEKAVLLARDIAKEIEGNMTYPGQIKVCVIRETRATSLAK